MEGCINDIGECDMASGARQRLPDVCAEDKQTLRRALRDRGPEEVRFRFDFEGAKVLAD